MIELGDIAIFLLLLLGLYVAWLSVLAREHAYHQVVRYCKRKDVQLLEQSVAFKSAWFKRDSNRYLRFWRSYKFEFSSTGDERYRGLIVILGRKVETITLEPYVLPNSELEGND